MIKSNWAKRIFLAGLRDIRGGRVRLECPRDTHLFGRPSGLDATVTVHDERFFRRALTGADIGAGESYMDGDWTTDNLVSVARLLLRNRRVIEGKSPVAGTLKKAVAGIARRLRDNSLSGSRANIRRHYDLGNDFFTLFLDSSLRMYSSGYFQSPHDSLETAQKHKVDRICRLLDLKPGDHVLEIGSGWGGFAAWAVEHYGCRVTTTTISEEQYRHVLDWKATAGAIGQRVEILKTDYRLLTGTFDKIVSIEMFEAVGLRHYDDYFAAVDRLLAPDGAMLLQTITVDDQWFPHYHGKPDWIEKHIFPGGELASVGEIVKSLARTTALSMYSAENFGTHYARTLRAWRSRFLDHLDEVRALGFDERFIRMWDFYLAVCEAAFLERHTGVFQLLLVKNGARRRLFNEPWRELERVAAPEHMAAIG
jgi:cyclopropane-fatty-acyl-phospholipid synthase